MVHMLHLEPIPSFEDNYIWAVHDGERAIFVDPGEAGPVLDWLARRGMSPAAVLVTHHHGDHCGGLGDILRDHAIPVYGPERDRIPGVNRPLREGVPCRVPELGLDFSVLEIPGHTLGHLAYVGHGWLFCGDALFSCGCGKVFEGTPAMLHASLQRLAGLPADTLVCCAHEYTLANLRFALAVDPDNPALLAWQDWSTRLRQRGEPTLPVHLGDELARNPFLRCAAPAVRAGVAGMSGQAAELDEAETFALLRALKNGFRPPAATG